MLDMPIMPDASMHVMQERSAESIIKEQAQNTKMIELGIDPYEYDIEKEYTEEEEKIINEALKLIVLEQEIPEELEAKVKAITGK